MGRKAVAEDCECPREGLGELVGSTAIRLLRVEESPDPLHQPPEWRNPSDPVNVSFN